MIQTDFIFISTDFSTALQPFLQPFLQPRPRCGSSSFAEKPCESEIVKKDFGLTIACISTAARNVAQAVCIGTRAPAQEALQVDGSPPTQPASGSPQHAVVTSDEKARNSG